MPECDVHLAHAAVYLAMAPKSNAVYAALGKCREHIGKSPAEPVPLQIRNAPTGLMKQLDYGKGYVYAHDTEEKMAKMSCLPDSMAGERFYLPTEQGREAAVKQRLEEIINWKKS
jgi:putative ATPase